MNIQAQPLKLALSGEFSVLHISYFTNVFKGFKNKFECIQLLFDVEYWMQIL